MKRPNAFVRSVTLALTVLGCAGCDLATKHVAETHLANRPTISLARGFIRLTYAENAGAFLSLGSDLPPAIRSAIFVGAVGVFMIAMLVIAARDREMSVTQLAVMGLIIGGGIGNLIDRIALGVVRDFLLVGWASLHTGIFNVGDMAITLGVLYLGFVLARDALRRRRESSPA